MAAEHSTLFDLGLATGLRLALPWGMGHHGALASAKRVVTGVTRAFEDGVFPPALPRRASKDRIGNV
jgi:hypothetical protein